MKFSKIKETCLYCHDLESARKFYHEQLGLEIINFLPGKHLFLRVGASVLLIFNPDDSKMKKSPPAHYAEGHQHFAFEVSADDYERTKLEMLERGIKVIDTLTWKNGQQSFYFNDPEGNVLEIVPEGIWN